MGKIIYILNRSSAQNFKIPLLWASAKTYFQENSKYLDEWIWADPNLDYSTPEQLAESIANTNPTIVGFSVYIWNEHFSLTLAKKLKSLSPSTYIIWGGPQCDIHYNENFFSQHQYIDLVVPSDAYGERSITDILDNISQNKKLIADQIQYCYYPSIDRSRKFNSLSPNKREFVWPQNLYRSQHKFIIPFILKNDRNVLLIETSRGCPYKCSFCDWGGGTYTKTVKKNFAIVIDEISWACENKIDTISFTDANFGMYSIDIEYIKHVIKEKEKYGFPKQVIIQPTKTKIDQLTKIYTLLAEHDLLSHYQISIQDLNDEVKKNVDRIDFSFEDQVQMFKQLQKIKYRPIWIESILGLPGSSISTVKESIQRISLEKLQYPLSHHWAMLPATPAADPSYREKFKLITVKGKSSIGVGSTKLVRARLGMVQDPGVIVSNDEDDITGEYVVGSFSYTPKEWIDMNILQIFTASMQNSNVLDLIADYLWEEYQIPYGDFFEQCVNTILTDEQVNPVLQKNYCKIKNKFVEWIDTACPDLFVDYHPQLNFTIAPSVYLIFVSLLEIDSFFDAVSIALSRMVNMTDPLKDLLNYSKQRVIDIDYLYGRKITVNYDWPKYQQQRVLEPQNKSFVLLDSQVLTGGRWFDIDWNQYQGLDRQKQYFYRVCYDFKSSKIAKNIDYQ